MHENMFLWIAIAIWAYLALLHLLSEWHGANLPGTDCFFLSKAECCLVGNAYAAVLSCFSDIKRECGSAYGPHACLWVFDCFV
jgi:hypothetical protein